MKATGNGSEDGRESDAQLVERIARAYAPAPLDEVGRARFDARLRERLEARSARGPRWWVTSLAGAGTLAALVLVAVGRGPLVDPAAPIETAALSTAALSAWEWDLMLGSGLEADEADDEGLPEDYAAIASAFLVP